MAQIPTPRQLWDDPRLHESPAFRQWMDAVTRAIAAISAPTTSPLTTKGDLYTFDTADARLGVGAEDEILTVASAEPTGNAPATFSAAAAASALAPADEPDFPAR